MLLVPYLQHLILLLYVIIKDKNVPETLQMELLLGTKVPKNVSLKQKKKKNKSHNIAFIL